MQFLHWCLLFLSAFFIKSEPKIFIMLQSNIVALHFKSTDNRPTV